MRKQNPQITDFVAALVVVLLQVGANHEVLAGEPTIATFAGTGLPGYSGDGGPANKAQLNNPYGIARGPDGTLYICDMDNHRIRRVAKDGTITTLAGTGKRGHAGDGSLALGAELNEPYEIRFDKAGNMFFVEMRNHLVRRVDAKTRIISTPAGNGIEGFSGDGGPAAKAQLRQPHSVQFDSRGDLYICDIGNHRVRTVDMKTGILSTFAGTGEKSSTPNGARFVNTPLNGPRAIDFDREGDMWLALREGNAIYRLDMKAGTIHHVAGTGQKGFTGNGGPAKQATLSGPKGISVGRDGNVYFADTESHTIRMIDVQKGTVELVAGTGERGDGPDGDPLKCKLARPHGIFVDAGEFIFIGDSENHRVRVIQLPGQK
jgi:streptogramin lyase